MDIGPVEYLILGFPGNNFTGQIVPELAKLIDSGLVRIIDLTFIMKDADGHVEVVEYDAVEELAAFAGPRLDHGVATPLGSTNSSALRMTLANRLSRP